MLSFRVHPHATKFYFFFPQESKGSKGEIEYEDAANN
jgi:hypothetical protein